MDRYKRNIIHLRIKIFRYMIIIGFFILIGRMYSIQIDDDRNLKLEGLKQRSTEINLSSKRGTIYDRNLIALTNNEAVKTLILSRSLINKDKELLKEVEEKTLLSKKELYNLLNSKNNLIQIPLEGEIEVGNRNNIFITDIINRYSSNNMLSHVIGYINKSENRGESGIEKTYDEFLNKTNKETLFIELDKKRSLILGSAYEVDNQVDAEDPAGVKLTIDYPIQKISEDILDQQRVKGSVIVAEIESGNILALVSRPSFDQDNILDSDYMALFNKGIQVSYPPGSIFKIVVLLAALEEDQNFINKEFYCKGYEEINGNITRCNSVHGKIGLKDGFAKSCNSVFIQIGLELGARKIINMARTLGLGSTLDIGLLEEVPGSLPEGNDLLGPAVGHISIGQDKIETTPLQITNIILLIANNGIMKDISIVKGITTTDGRMIKPYNLKEDERVISVESSTILREYLEEVLNSGTARSIDLDREGGAAGKTGSAEGVSKGSPTVHGWFAGYYPRVDPKYVITVLVEDANSGSKSAAPIFESICKEIYKLY